MWTERNDAYTHMLPAPRRADETKISRAHQLTFRRGLCMENSDQMWMCLYKHCSLLYMLFFISLCFKFFPKNCHIGFWTRRRFGGFLCIYILYIWWFCDVPPTLIYSSSLVTINLLIWYVYNQPIGMFWMCERLEKKNLRMLCVNFITYLLTMDAGCNIWIVL